MYTFEVVYGVSKFIDLVAAADENLAILEKQLERQERMKYLISKLNDVPLGFAARNMERICEYETDMSIVRIFPNGRMIIKKRLKNSKRLLTW